MKRILLVIPARLKSKRFPEKIFHPILGLPMIHHIYNRIKIISKIAKILIAVDHKKTLNYCKKFNIPAIMTSVLAKSGTHRLIELAKNYPADVYINVQCDEPLIHFSMIEQVLEYYLKKKKNGVLSLKTKIKSVNEFLDPNVVKVVTDSKDYALYFSRSPIPYSCKYYDSFKHIGIYAYCANNLKKISCLSNSILDRYENLEQLNFLYNRIPIKVLETSFESISVDLLEDIIKVENFLKKIND